jgi:phage shock protein A
MKESITSRVGRIIAGGAHKMVSMLENSAPEMVLGEAIREIDDALYEIRSELGKVIAKKHLITNRLREENSKHEDLYSKAELAIRQEREDLAEAAVSHQLDIEAQIPVLENTISECSKSEKELEGYIAALQAKKREMQEELTIYCKSNAEAASLSNFGQKSMADINNIAAKVVRAESVFDRILQKGISSVSNVKTESQMAELEDLSRKNSIKERLSAIKGKMSET